MLITFLALVRLQKSVIATRLVSAVAVSTCKHRSKQTGYGAHNGYGRRVDTVRANFSALLDLLPNFSIKPTCSKMTNSRSSLPVLRSKYCSAGRHCSTHFSALLLAPAFVYLVLAMSTSCSAWRQLQDKEFNESRKVLNGKATKLWKQWPWVCCGLVSSTWLQPKYPSNTMMCNTYSSSQYNFSICTAFFGITQATSTSTQCPCCNFKKLASRLHNIE